MPDVDYQKHYGDHLGEGLDEGLEGLCTAGVLTWLPWVGKRYTEHRVLVVGESHYGKTHGTVGAEVDIKEAMRDSEYTRKVIVECALLAHPPDMAFFANTERALLGVPNPSEDRRVKLWEGVAYYNFVQRALNRDGGERPNGADFQAGWNTFASVVKVLRPKVCLFLGVAASNYFNGAEFSDGLTRKENILTRKEKITWGGALNGVYKREGGSISHEDNQVTPIYFIKHPSKCFRWQEWSEYLGRKDGLQVFRSDDNPALPVAAATAVDSPETTAEPPDDEKLAVPTNLSHKPIVACDYSATAPGEDAKFLSVGHAQYNREEASVKILRANGGRWSRQSEEVPIQRLGHMMQLLLWAIRESQEDATKPTHLRETVLFPDEMDFLRREFHANRDGLVKSIREIRTLIDGIDLDKI